MALVFNIFTFNMLEVFAKTDEVNFSADSSDFVLLIDELVQKGYRLKIYDVYRPQGYIAEHSGHSIGSTVDLTLFDMNTEKDVDMGGTFDYFGELSHPYYTGITSRQYANRMLLRDVMIRHGFKPLAEEWWHFTLKNEPYKDTYFTFPVTTKSVVSSANTTSSTASTTMLGNSPDWIAKL